MVVITFILKCLGDESLLEIVSDDSVLDLANYQSISERILTSIDEWSTLFEKIANRKPMPNDSFYGDFAPVGFVDIFEVCIADETPFLYGIVIMSRN